MIDDVITLVDRTLDTLRRSKEPADLATRVRHLASADTCLRQAIHQLTVLRGELAEQVSA